MRELIVRLTLYGALMPWLCACGAKATGPRSAGPREFGRIMDAEPSKAARHYVESRLSQDEEDELAQPTALELRRLGLGAGRLLYEALLRGDYPHRQRRAASLLALAHPGAVREAIRLTLQANAEAALILAAAAPRLAETNSPAIRALLADPRNEVQILAAEALLQMSSADTDATAVLSTALRSNSEAVVFLALASVRELGPRSAAVLRDVIALRTHPSAGFRALECVEHMGPAAAPVRSSVLEAITAPDAETWIVSAGAKALAAMGRPGAEALASILQRANSREVLIQAVVGVLQANVAPRIALPALMPLVEHGTTAVASRAVAGIALHARFLTRGEIALVMHRGLADRGMRADGWTLTALESWVADRGRSDRRFVFDTVAAAADKILEDPGNAYRLVVLLILDDERSSEVEGVLQRLREVGNEEVRRLAQEALERG